jgi:hypothetical protein
MQAIFAVNYSGSEIIHIRSIRKNIQFFLYISSLTTCTRRTKAHGFAVFNVFLFRTEFLQFRYPEVSHIDGDFSTFQAAFSSKRFNLYTLRMSRVPPFDEICLFSYCSTHSIPRCIQVRRVFPRIG